MSDYAARWLAIAGVAALAMAGLWARGVSLDLDSVVLAVKAIGGLLVALPGLLAFALLLPHLKHAVAAPVDLVLSMAQLLAVPLVFLPISYLAAAWAADTPFLDATLAHLDAVLFGFDWDEAARWVADRPAIEQVLSAAYFSLLMQALGLLVIGSLIRPGERNSELIWIAMVSMAVTTVISVFTPAIGKIGHVGTDYVDVLHSIRSGAWRVFSLKNGEGIVTFPSFHTTLAVTNTYVAARLHRRALVAFGALNLVMLLAIPPIGGHYLVDLLGGAAVAVVSIIVVRAGRRRLKRSIQASRPSIIAAAHV